MNEAEVRALSLAGAGDSEELARAELYGLLSRLWFAPPDPALLDDFAVAVTQAPMPGSHLEAPWQDLVFEGHDVDLTRLPIPIQFQFAGSLRFDSRLLRRLQRSLSRLSPPRAPSAPRRGRPRKRPLRPRRRSAKPFLF